MALANLDNFYVTLPSSTNLDLYPQNAVTHYTTELSRPLDFDDHQYEVALVELHLRGVLLNLEKHSTLLHIIIQLTEEEYDNNFIIKQKLFHNIHDSNNTVELYESQGEFLCRIPISLPSGSYNDINQVVDEMNNILNPKDDDLLFFYIEYTGYLQLKGSLVDERSFSVIATDSFRNLMGLKNQKKNPIMTNKRNRFRVNTSKYSNFDFEGGEILIYSDIVEHNHIGNTMGQLLRVVSPKYENLNLKSSLIFHSPHYVPVVSSRIITINLELRSLIGEYYPIESGHCIIKLHFRKIEKNYM